MYNFKLFFYLNSLPTLYAVSKNKIDFDWFNSEEYKVKKCIIAKLNTSMVLLVLAIRIIHIDPNLR